MVAGCELATYAGFRAAVRMEGSDCGVLLDMGGDDPNIGATICDLSSRGLIKLEEY